MTTTATDLRNAAQYIRNHGWWQGGEGLGPDGQVCAAQAMKEVTEFRHRHRVFRVFRDYIGQEFVATWNDAPERTEAQVLDALEGAARSVEGATES